MSHENCVCADLWRFEVTDLITGRVKGVVHPLSVSWETPLNAPGTGTMIVATKDVTPADLWPHRTGLYISLIQNGQRVGYFGGIIDRYSADATGSCTVGFFGIDGYLKHRVLADDDGGVSYQVVHREQTLIAADLVTAANLDGVPLTAVAEPSSFFRDRAWHEWEFKNIGDAVDELTKIINGVQYDVVHEYTDGFWASVMRFRDSLGAHRGVVLKGGREAQDFGLDVDAKDHATFVVAVGEGEEVDQKESVARDQETSLYPRFDGVPAFKDVSDQTTLDEHSVGWVVDHRDPSAIPSLMVAGLDNPPPEFLSPGDFIGVDVSAGIATYRGDARVLSIGWSLDGDSPTMRNVSVLATTRPVDSVLLQTPSDDCVGC